MSRRCGVPELHLDTVRRLYRGSSPIKPGPDTRPPVVLAQLLDGYLGYHLSLDRPHAQLRCLAAH